MQSYEIINDCEKTKTSSSFSSPSSLLRVQIESLANDNFSISHVL